MTRYGSQMKRALPFKRKKYTIEMVKPVVDTSKLKKIREFLNPRQQRRQINIEDDQMITGLLIKNRISHDP